MKHEIFLVHNFIKSFLLDFPRWDLHLLEKLNLHHAPTWDAAMNIITYSAAYVSILIPLICFYVAFRQKDAYIRIKAWFVISCLVTASLCSWSLKNIVQRPRPWHTYAFIEKKTSGGGWSFPSGHTTGAFAVAFSMSIAFRRKRWMMPVLLGWASVVGYSRMDLGVHYPSDILGGICIAALVVGLNYIFFKKAFQRYQDNMWKYNIVKSDPPDLQS
ncbi:phosphatase PAP2 family protein [Thermoflavifilum thermophilum]|uniref:Undecaprenyl-diphosphatase n=1 Tax=Thermoflavifilum thermophilum TaxID=1393122 RepID=A0A1I7NEM8_9BACT|nr:phosphatase PAP2 family protein [Thermoflavifilum thermophilum]SFV33099.1 undecaprenyl-diphosphatase [Thermoflavifilum thermophilum]